MSEFIARCRLCDWDEAWTTEAASQSAAAWHVWVEHHARWIELMGSNRRPRDPKPSTVGSKFEGWERQS